LWDEGVNAVQAQAAVLASVRRAKAAERLTEKQVLRQCARPALAPEQLAPKQAQARRVAAAAAVTATARVMTAADRIEGGAAGGEGWQTRSGLI